MPTVRAEREDRQIRDAKFTGAAHDPAQGFDATPMLMMPYHLPYQGKLVEAEP